MNLISGPKNKSGRKKIYPFDAIQHLKNIWERVDYICAKRMKAALPLWIGHYNCRDDVRSALLKMSASTIDRYLKPFRAALRRRRNCGTKPGRLIKNMIPIKPLDWNVTEPGFVEADTVAHCGDSLSGEFVWSLTLTDVFSGWTENRAIWGKSSHEVLDMVRDIEQFLPFILKGFSTDNGSEFLNHRLVQYFCSPENPQRKVLFHRSRAYKKNDQCHVEQKNWTHVRQLFGYCRFDDRRIVGLMNILYRDYCSILQNFFMPQVKLIRKTRIGSRYKREYTAPMTPYERLLQCPSISEEKKEELRRQHAALDPFELTKAIRKQLQDIVKLMKPLATHKSEAA
jgi:hypothetical protein